jgi:hypothetical protein
MNRKPSSMGIAGVEPHELALTVGTMGSGSTDSPAPLQTTIDLPASTASTNSSTPTRVVGDIPNRYTSDVVLNQQARVAHQGGMADCLPCGLVAGKPMAVLDAGAHGGSADKPMVGCLVVHA